jgi:integrase
LSHWLVRKYFVKACKIGGITDITFHDLRHSFAQRLLTKGVPIYKVSKILGHSSVVVTEKHYGHLAFSDLKTAVDHIDGVLSRPDCTQVALEIGNGLETSQIRSD